MAPAMGVYHDLEAWRAFLTAAGFTELEHYYRPAGLLREQQPWLASVWRKLGMTTDTLFNGGREPWTNYALCAYLAK